MKKLFKLFTPKPSVSEAPPDVIVMPDGLMLHGALSEPPAVSGTRRVRFPDGIKWTDLDEFAFDTYTPINEAATPTHVMRLTVSRNQTKSVIDHIFTSTSKEAVGRLIEAVQSQVWNHLQSRNVAKAYVDSGIQQVVVGASANRLRSPKRFKRYAFIASAFFLVIGIAVASGIAANRFLYKSDASSSIDLTSMSTEQIANLESSPLLQKQLRGSFEAAIAEGSEAGKAASAKIQKDQFEAMKSLGLNPGTSQENAMACLAHK